MNTNQDGLFLCPETKSEHRIGQDAVDAGHGARPTGPQICLNCRRTLSELVHQEVLRKEMELYEGWLNWVESGGGHIDRVRLKNEIFQLRNQLEPNGEVE